MVHSGENRIALAHHLQLCKDRESQAEFSSIPDPARNPAGPIHLQQPPGKKYQQAKLALRSGASIGRYRGTRHLCTLPGRGSPLPERPRNIVEPFRKVVPGADTPVRRESRRPRQGPALCRNTGCYAASSRPCARQTSTGSSPNSRRARSCACMHRLA